MAKKKKSRVPAPPSSVQAPKRREEPRKPRVRGSGGPRDPRRLRLWLAGAGGLIAIVAVAVGLAFALGGGDGGRELSSDDLAAVGCELVTSGSDGQNHVTEVPENFEYSTFPASSGPHHPEPAIWNVYDRPVEQLRLIHNLEHGGIIVQYGDGVAAETVQQMVAWYRTSPEGVILGPLPELGDAIALTAWTRLLTCSSGFDEQAFSDFRDAFRFRGPETLPSSTYEPGFNTGVMPEAG